VEPPAVSATPVDDHARAACEVAPIHDVPAHRTTRVAHLPVVRGGVRPVVVGDPRSDAGPGGPGRLALLEEPLEGGLAEPHTGARRALDDLDAEVLALGPPARRHLGLAPRTREVENGLHGEARRDRGAATAAGPRARDEPPEAVRTGRADAAVGEPHGGAAE